jgi:hypothetical protein
LVTLTTIAVALWLVRSGLVGLRGTSRGKAA